MDDEVARRRVAPTEPHAAGRAAAGPGRRALLALLAAVAVLVPLLSGCGELRAAAGAGRPVAILAGEPASIDPARHGDLGSAAFVSQLYETLTAVDTGLAIRPALAEAWSVEDDGRRVVFRLRDGLVFSDGTPLRAGDVVRSWRRVFAPGDPSPLASLAAEIRGARALLDGTAEDPAMLGVRAADDRTVVVDLERGGGDLPAIVSGAPFAVVPPSAGDDEILPVPGALVGSGAYVLAAIEPDAWVLEANPRHWAGAPAVATVRLVTTIGGRSAVDAFAAGELDIAEIGHWDASWIAYDPDLGPSLRSEPSLSVTYYGFDTTRPPFDDRRVRRAVALAVDWRRLALLDEPGSSVPANGIVPVGIPGTPEGDFLPPFDPAEARRLLAEAGHPGGAGLPRIDFIASGRYDGAIGAMLEEHLGVRVAHASMGYLDYVRRLEEDPPELWAISWVADYPGPNDFLGVLLGTGSTANQGGWSDPRFDAAIADATASSDPAAALEAYRRALELVRDEVPVVPVAYGTAYTLVRDGLLGAATTGTGIRRLAGMAWSGVP